MTFEQVRTLLLVIAAFLVGLSAAVLGGCTPEHDYQTPDAMNDGPQGTRRGPGPSNDASMTIEAATSIDSTPRIDVSWDALQEVPAPDVQPRPDAPDVQPGPDTTVDLTTLTDGPIDLPRDQTTLDAGKDLTADVGVDLPRDLSSPDRPPDITLLKLGSACGSSAQCSSSHCTDSVCCNVAKCVDTCVPSGGTSCPPYNGFTCAPYGSCRAY